MKKMRRFISFMLAMVMVLAMGMSAMAATVTNKTDHTYNVYQVFKGTQTEVVGDTKLGDIDWGTGINSENFLNALKTDSRFESGTPAANVFSSALTAAKVAEILAENTSMAEAFANVAAEHTATVYTTVNANGIIQDLPAGYYLFVDTATVGVDDAMNSALLQITNATGGLTIDKKYDVPIFDKDIIENDQNVEATDKAIGDTVTYELTGTLPTNYDDYETYKYVFHDKISVGQAIDFESFKITLNSSTGADITELFKNSLTEDTDGNNEQEFTLTCNNLKTNTNIKAESKIYVRYNVTITNEVVIGSAGNSNEGWLEYSNNPNGDGKGTSTTTHDSNLVFTYELNPTKVDGKDSKVLLSNAQFALKAIDGEHKDKYVLINTDGKVSGWTNDEPEADDEVDAEGNTGVLVSGANGKFIVYGLDSGTYNLIEIKAPLGYNLLEKPVDIVIEANIDASEETGPKLTELIIKVDDEASSGYADTGILPVTVENNRGAVLPSTGGVGTTMFYVIGGALVLVAVVLLVTRKRMSVEK